MESKTLLKSMNSTPQFYFYLQQLISIIHANAALKVLLNYQF